MVLLFRKLKIISNRNLFPFSDYYLIGIRRKTQDYFTLRGLLVTGKPMEPRIMTTCSVYFLTFVNQFSVPTSLTANYF